jgi:hypothetical protein
VCELSWFFFCLSRCLGFCLLMLVVVDEHLAPILDSLHLLLVIRTLGLEQFIVRTCLHQLMSTWISKAEPWLVVQWRSAWLWSSAPTTNHQYRTLVLLDWSHACSSTLYRTLLAYRFPLQATPNSIYGLRTLMWLFNVNGCLVSLGGRAKFLMPVGWQE